MESGILRSVVLASSVTSTAAHALTSLFLACSLALSLFLTVQATYTLFLMLYTWDQPDAYRTAQAPARFLRPQKSFTILLPCRHEEEVIQSTIDRVIQARYPLSLLEVVVICSPDDTGTIAKAQEKIAELHGRGVGCVRVIAYRGAPINKPHGLNAGVRVTRHEVVTIFDAEDDIHPDIFNVVNTLMVSERVNIVQCGVQLMNYQTNWYSALNVLEYFFWFKSRLHYHARIGSVTLGGNTVFLTRDIIERVGGWDEHNLTEDADIGIRASLLGEPIRVVYDDRYVTREETPPTLAHFIKQRTRWSQGFLQTLKKGEWLRLSTFGQRLLAIYTLSFPIVQSLLGLYTVVALVAMLTIKTPVLVSIILFLPFYLLIAHFFLSAFGLYDFAEAHGLKPQWKTVVILAVGFLPYQWVLAYAALRATWRQLRGINNWEKTKHVGAHREHVGVADDAATARDVAA
jgi:cellulose synthase/poly-beta-1,6-N-acetylglucosamine synthase-like glycosyltransferase